MLHQSLSGTPPTPNAQKPRMAIVSTAFDLSDEVKRSSTCRLLGGQTGSGLTVPKSTRVILAVVPQTARTWCKAEEARASEAWLNEDARRPSRWANRSPYARRSRPKCPAVPPGSVPARARDVALACGFADQSHLTRVFTRSVGVSPGAWRRALDE
jgi:AraC-like DNA-binding protein